MGEEQLGQVLAQALELSLWLLVPALAAAVLAGLLSAIGQAVTGVTDAALGFVPKLLAVALALLLAGAWMQQRLVAFTLELWKALP